MPIWRRAEGRKGTAPAWTQEALARYAQLEGRLEFVPEKSAEPIRAKLALARELLEDPTPRSLSMRLPNWWNGDRIERTWTWLEEAEIEIVQHSNDVGLRIAMNIARQRAEGALGEKDPRRVALEELAKRNQ
jgi:hypothetical protein